MTDQGCSLMSTWLLLYKLPDRASSSALWWVVKVKAAKLIDKVLCNQQQPEVRQVQTVLTWQKWLQPYINMAAVVQAAREGVQQGGGSSFCGANAKSSIMLPFCILMCQLIKQCMLQSGNMCVHRRGCCCAGGQIGLSAEWSFRLLEGPAAV